MFKSSAWAFLTIATLAWSLESKAQTSTTIHHHYQAPRALGMGDAFVAVANDYSALFYNPAGLARRDDGQVNLSMSYAGTPGVMDFYNDYSDIESSPMNDTDKQTAYLELIQRHYGDVYGMRVSPLEGFWVRPNWGVAFIPIDFSTELAMHQQVGPMINATVYADTTLAFGYGDDLHGVVDHGRLSWGVTGKFVNRGYFSKPISATELANSSEIVSRNDLLEGYTVDADVGVLWTPELPDSGFWSLLRLARPTFGAVARNIGELGFAQSFKLVNDKQNGTPEKLYRVFDIGSRWEYPSFWIFSGRGVMDIRDIGHPDFNYRKGLHLGFEFDWTVASWWRGHYRVGLSQSYWTAGVSAELGIFNLDVVSYANDVGTRNTPIESRVYAARLNLDF